MKCERCLKYTGFNKVHDCAPVTVRYELVWIPKDPTRRERGLVEGAKIIDIPEGVKQVYTLINPDPEGRGTYSDENKKPDIDTTKFVPAHRVNCLFEDAIHDWNQRGTKFYYMSRFVGGDVWVMVEYHDAMKLTVSAEQYAKERTIVPPFKKGQKVRLKKGCRIDITTSPRYDDGKKEKAMGRTTVVTVHRAAPGWRSDRPENSVTAQIVWSSSGYWFHSSDFENMEAVD